MATPTPSSASKRPGANVSTPSHLHQSSPPRSIPSPAAARLPAGKTPVNHPTGGSSGSKTLSGTPMVRNSSQTGNTSSPSANMLSFNTPTGLGIDGITPMGMNIPTPALGGVNMMPTMSDLGLTSSTGKRNEDEERRAKMRKVLKRIGRTKGRVSEEGIARIGRRVGFENDIDAEKLSQEDIQRKVGNRPITTAGNVVAVDVNMRENVPQRVQVTYFPGNPSSQIALREQGDWAGQVLMNDLREPVGISLDAQLDRYALNLERLARMDRLSGKGINCFEALSVIYTSLRRLYEEEKKASIERMKDSTSASEEKADYEITWKKSGKPLLHARGKLGLEIAYWREGGGKSEDADQNLHTLRLEAEPSPAGLYPSLRVPVSWLPDPLDLSNNELGENIPWHDPPLTLLPADMGANDMTVEVGQKVPDLRFVAKLDPPLVVPTTTAGNIFNAVGAPAPQMLEPPCQYAAVLLDAATEEFGQASTASFGTSSEREVLSVLNGEETTMKHRYSLDCAKPAYAEQSTKISDLPFSHPRQLVELLPTLRQWACFGSLLKSTCARSTSDAVVGQMVPPANRLTNGHLTLEELLNSPASVSSDTSVPINITVVASPVPTLGIAFPTNSDSGIGNITLQIHNNAESVVTNHAGITSAVPSDENRTQKLANALEVCGDLGVWIEWLRTRAQQPLSQQE